VAVQGTNDGNQKGREGIKDIRERSFAFAVRVLKFCQYLENSKKVNHSLIRQLIKSGTSIGANLEEAQAGQSKPDFIHKNAIALKESRETNYWLRLLNASYDFEEKVRIGIEELTNESSETSKIIGSIIVSSKRKP
jgi:four helix bundle protein